ncbi:hypothetical protein AVEN_15526-1 [Araneus ventricosus]|uniref:Pre-C2HC domain-containing protein n=1 Tax=Araneus ventricosus TaxID=182803 RepID=A0A4Y2RNC5_ARAVE|nr:hypothetical protein AVEN_15526-1 [Araneus ventricosus]
MSGGDSEELSRDCAIPYEVESMETQTSPAHNFSIEELKDRCSRLAQFNTTKVFLEREIKFSKEELKSIKLSPEANYLNEFISSKESEIARKEGVIANISGEINSISPCLLERCPIHCNTQAKNKRGADSQNKSACSSPIKTKSAKTNENSNFITPSKRLTTKHPQAQQSSQPQILLKNAFNGLTESSDEPKPLPINIRITENYNLLLQEINRKFPGTENKHSNGYIKTTPKNSDDYRDITKLLKEKKQDFYIMVPRDERPIKVVIKDLPIFTDTETIKTELEELRFFVNRVTQLKQIRTKKPLPMFLIELTRSPNAEKIYNLTNFLNLKIKIENFKKRPGYTQC